MKKTITLILFISLVTIIFSQTYPGTIIDVKCTDNKIRKGEICTLPMYDPKGEIVRGINKDIPNKPKPWIGIKKS